MSSTPPDLEFNWLYAPNCNATDSVQEVGEIVHGDYNVSLGIRLFRVIESRIAQIILYFDDFTLDERLKNAICAELVRT